MAEKIGLEAVLETSNFTSGTKTYLTGIGQMNKATTGVTKNLSSQFVGLGQTLLKVGAIAGGAALAGITALGAGVATFAVSGIKKAAELDQQMAAIAATMGKTKEEIEPLKDLILDLALDPNLTVNTTEAAQAIELLARNGVEATDIIGGMAEATVALANATGADFGVAADVATDVMALFNKEASEMTAVIDGITGVTTNSKFTIDDYRLGLANAGGIAAGFGVTLEDLNTVMVATSASFSSGADAGTSLKTLLQRLANPTKEVSKLMEQYGIELFNSDGSMRGLADVADDLHSAFSGLTEAQKAQLASTLGGADGARTLLGLSELTRAEFIRLSETVNENGQAFKAAATRVDSVKGAMDILGGIIEAIQIQIGDKLLPIVRLITVAFAEIASQVGPQIVAFFGTLADLMEMGINAVSSYVASLGGLGVIMTNIGATVGPIIAEAFSFLIFTVFPALVTAIQFVNQNWEAFRGAIVGIGVVLAGAAISALIAGIGAALATLLSPIGLIIAAAALLGAAWSTNFLGIRDVAATVISFLSGVFQVVFVWLSEQIPLALQSLQNIWTASWPIILGVLLTAWEVIQSIFMALQEAFFQVSTNLNEAFNILATTLSGLGITWSDVFNAILTATGVVFAIIGALILGLVAAFTSIIVALSEVVVFVTEMMQQLVMVSQLAITGIIQLFTGLGQIIKGIVTADFTLIVEGITNLFTGLIAALTGIFATIFTVIATPIGAIVVLISSFVQNIISFFETMFNALVGGSIIPDMVALIIQSFQSLLSPVQTVFTGIQTAIQGTVAGVQGFIGTLSGIVLPDALNPGSPTPFERGLQGIAKVLKGPLTIAFKLFTEAAALSFGIVESQLASIRLTMEEIITVTIPELVRAGEELSSSFTKAASSILAAFNNLANAISGVTDALEAMPKAIDIVITISDVLQDIKDIGTAVGDIDDDVEVEIEIVTTDLSISDVEDLLDLLGSFPSQVKTSIQVSQKGKLPGPAAQVPIASTIATIPAAVSNNQVVNNVIQNFSINFAASEVAQTEAQSALLMRQEIQRQLANV